MKILSSDRKNITDKLLKELYEAPFKYNSNKNFLYGILHTFEKTHSFLNEYIAHYKKQQFRFFENGMLDYTNITKNQSSNSYIENYNRRIKLNLSKYLYGKSKCEISQPLFLYFIKTEEKEAKEKNYS